METRYTSLQQVIKISHFGSSLKTKHIVLHDSFYKKTFFLFCSVDIKFDTKYMTNINVYSDGSVSWIPPGIVQISCDMQIKWFPFDEQDCYFKVIF